MTWVAGWKFVTGVSGGPCVIITLGSWKPKLFAIIWASMNVSRRTLNKIYYVGVWIYE